MAFFQLPMKVVQTIDRMRQNFLWKGGPTTSAGHCLVNWNIVCQPKTMGGLGIKNLSSQNSAMCCKWWWKLHSRPDLPWTKLIRHKYYHSTHPSNPIATTGCGISHFWKHIMKLSPLFNTSTFWNLGNGNLCSLWYNKWSLDIVNSPCIAFPTLFSFVVDQEATIAQFLQHEAWVHEYRAPLSSDGFLKLMQLNNILEATTLTDEEDTIIWRRTSNGIFIAKSAYNSLSFGGIKDFSASIIWNTKAPLSAKIFMWLASRGKILTADNLIRKGWPHPPSCPLCNREPEIAIHLFNYVL